jgi:hypothetical protein
MSDSVLRVGEITGAFYPGDAGNQSGTEVEYMVMVRRRDGNGKLLPTPYRCVMKDGFGSAGDHSRHSVRARSAEQADQEVGNGAIVLIACINADMNQGVILDCLRHPKRSEHDPKGRFYDFKFNGIGVNIGDDGTLKVTVEGPTDNAGSPSGTQPDRPTAVTFEPDGSVTVDTAGTIKLGSPDAGEQLVLGNQLVDALNELIQIFTQQPIIGNLGFPGGIPVVVAQQLLLKLLQWQLKWSQAPTQPLLADRQFTEKG